MSWPSVLTLGLGLLLSRSSAVTVLAGPWHHNGHAEGDEPSDANEWWYPVSGMLKVYDLNGDLFPAPAHRRPHHAPLSLLEDSAETVETKAHVDGSVNAIGHIAVAGAGAGQTGAQLTFAGATSAAAKKAAFNATGNALVANSVAATSIRGAAATKKTTIPIIGWMAWIRMTLSTGFIVKSMCMVCNVFYQASPMPLILDYSAKGDTADADLAPFIALAYSGWQWCFYGTFAFVVTGKSGFLVLVYSNVVGATLGLYYVYAFLTYCKNQAMISRSTKYYYVLFCVVAVQFIAVSVWPPVKALFFSGLISSTWSTITSCSLLVSVPKVYETKSSRSLPFPLLVVGAISAIMWIVCGVMLWDPWITFPNVIALTVCSFALYLCHIFPNDKDGLAEDVTKIEEQDEDQVVRHISDVERASPLQRALDYVNGSSSSESQSLQDSQSSMYGATGGTGESPY